MPEMHGYRWGAWFFGLVALCSLAALPFAATCCSRFSAEDMAADAALGGNGWSPDITPLAIALLDWPMGFRLLLMTSVAAILCFATTVTLLFVRQRNAERQEKRILSRVGVAQAVLGSFMVGVLYILAAYAVGYVGYRGPANALWFIGIPMAVAVMQKPSIQSALLWTIPLLLGGWLSMGILSMTIGIPLD